MRELAAGFALALREELDFRVEAANMAAIGAAARAVVIPVPHRELCTRRLLVMQRLDGVPLAAAGPEIAARGLDPYALARTLLDTLLRQVVLDGVFHADPHPGNVLLLADGRLALLDFGSVGRLDVTVRAALQQLLLAVDRGDPVAVSDALLEVVPRPDEIDAAALERAVGVVLARHLGPGGTPGLRMFADLVRIVTGFGLSVPPAVAAVFRALATGEGTLTALAPGFDVVAEARRFATAQLSEQWRAASPRQLVTDELVTLLPMLRRVPRRVDRILAATEAGRLALTVPAVRRRAATAGTPPGWCSSCCSTVLGATAGLMAVLLLGTTGGPAVTATSGSTSCSATSCWSISSVLVLRVLVLIFRPNHLRLSGPGGDLVAIRTDRVMTPVRRRQARGSEARGASIRDRHRSPPPRAGGRGERRVRPAPADLGVACRRAADRVPGHVGGGGDRHRGSSRGTGCRAGRSRPGRSTGKQRHGQDP